MCSITFGMVKVPVFANARQSFTFQCDWVLLVATICSDALFSHTLALSLAHFCSPFSLFYEKWWIQRANGRNAFPFCRFHFGGLSAKVYPIPMIWYTKLVLYIKVKRHCIHIIIRLKRKRVFNVILGTSYTASHTLYIYLHTEKQRKSTKTHGTCIPLPTCFAIPSSHSHSLDSDFDVSFFPTLVRHILARHIR